MPQVTVDMDGMYFLYLPRLGQVRYAYSLISGGSSIYNGSLPGFMGCMTNGYLPIPIPVELAMALHWVTLDEVGQAFDLPLHIRTAIKIGVTGEQTA